MNDEFYIGWETKAPAAYRRTIRVAIAVLALGAVVIPVLLAVSQQMIGAGVFEWGTVKKFSGILKVDPYPHLLVPRPGTTGAQNKFSTYYLVAPFKHGLDREKISGFDGRVVSLDGTLIYRGNQTMVEALPDSIKPADTQPPSISGVEPVLLGRQTFTGEIVDSKCWLGVMNPGALTPHRACAIRCISGGIPPVLLLRRANAPPVYLLLVSADGRPVNQQILDLVARPVEITGEVERQGDLLILKADPATCRPVK